MAVYIRRMQKEILRELNNIFSAEDLSRLPTYEISMMIRDLYVYENRIPESSRILHPPSSLFSRGAAESASHDIPLTPEMFAAIIAAGAMGGDASGLSPEMFANIISSGAGLSDSVVVPLPSGILESMETFRCPDTHTYEDCFICKEKIQSGDPLMRTKCNHTAHSPCLSMHFQLSVKCPICRHDQRENTQ